MDESAIQYRKIMYYFHGPVQETFVFTYSQTYTKDVDMLTHLQQSGLCNNFNVHEMSFLKNEKRPLHIPIQLLFKIIQHCCSPSLSSHDSKNWKENSENSTVESQLVTLINFYREFLKHGIEPKNYFDAGKIREHSSKLIELAAAKSGTKRWPEAVEKISNFFKSIDDKSFFKDKLPFDMCKMELKTRTDRTMQTFEQEILDIDCHSWDLNVPFSETEESEDEYRNIDLNDIIESSNSKERILLLEANQGVGKTTLASYILITWYYKSDIPGLKNFDIVNVNTAQESDNGNIMEKFFPLVQDMDKFVKEIEGKKVLLIVDDSNKLKESDAQQILSWIKNIPNLFIALLGHVSASIKKLLSETESANVVLNGYKKLKLIQIAENQVALYEGDSIDTLLRTHMNRIVELIRYPRILKEMSKTWACNSSLYKKSHSVSDFMWNIVDWAAKQHLNMDLKYNDDKRKKFFSWLKFTGKKLLPFASLKVKPTEDCVSAIEAEMLSLFPVTGKNFIDRIFIHCSTHCSKNITLVRSSLGLPIIEFFCGWYLMQEILNRVPLNEVLDIPENYMNPVLYTAGHLERMQDEGSLTIAEEKRIIKALVYFSPESFENLFFIFRLVTELHCIKRLVELVIDDTEYNEEWNMNCSDVQLKSMQVLLSHVSPKRLLFLVDDNVYNNLEAIDVMAYTCRVKVSVWLDSTTQFEYGNKGCLDNLLEPFLIEKVYNRLDLISGYVTTNCLNSLTTASGLKNLVFLKLRITSYEELNPVLKASKCFPRLLWLEIKFDFDLDDINVLNLESTDVPMFDVYFRGIEEWQVTKLADILMTMHLRFTGIHLEHTSFTPEGVYTFLKELAKRKVTLCAEKDIINKFRRWYYPNLNSIPKWKPLTEEQILDNIGFDDSKFYSDHKVVSSRFVTNLDAWNLKSYLESEEEIRHFCYEASNIVFTKELNKKVEASFKGEYFESIQQSSRKLSKASNTQINIQKVSDFEGVY